MFHDTTSTLCSSSNASACCRYGFSSSNESLGRSESYPSCVMSIVRQFKMMLKRVGMLSDSFRNDE